MKFRIILAVALQSAGALVGCADEDAVRPARTAATVLSGQVVGPADAGFPAGTDMIGPIPAAAAAVPVTGTLVRVSADGRAVAEDFTLSGGRFRLTAEAVGDVLAYARIAAMDGQPWAGLTAAKLASGKETALAAPLSLTAAAVAWGELAEAADLIAAPDLGRAIRPLADGTWLLGELPSGSLRLWALRDGYEPVELSVEMTAGRAMAVTFPAIATTSDDATVELGGQVVDDLSGIAVAGALVEAGNRMAVSAADGRYRLQVPAGNLVVRVSADGFLPAARAVEAAVGQSRVVDIGLPRSRHFGQTGLIGVVTAGDSGQPVTGAEVAIVGTDTRTTVGADGKFSLGTAAGCVALRAIAEGFGSAARVVCGAPGRSTVVGQLALPDEGLRCVADRERCGDGRDNNCDGLIDEGCDRTPPEAVALSKVVLTMAAPGQSDTLLGLPGAAEPGARMVITAYDTLVQEIARPIVAADGSFDVIDLGDNAVENLQLVVVDAAGNASPPVLLVNDVTRPRSFVLTGPAAIARSADASFTFESDEPVTTTVCRLGAGAWRVCSSPWLLTGLGYGPHTFAVRATDVAGNAGREDWGDADTWSWTVEPAFSTVSSGQAAAAPPVLVPDGRGGADLVIVRADGQVERRRGADLGATRLWRVNPAANAGSEDPPLVVDLDGDGELDLLVASGTRRAYVGLRGTDGAESVGGPWPVTAVNRWVTAAAERPRASLVSAYFAPDGVTSWVGLAWLGTADPRLLHRYRADSTTPTATALMLQTSSSALNGNPAAHDVDGDGLADVLIVDSDLVRAFRGADLAPLWTTGPVGSSSAQRVDPVVAHLAGATTAAVLVRHGDRRLVALAADDGRVLWDEALGVDDVLSQGFIVGDLDGDAVPQVIAALGSRVEVRDLLPSGLGVASTILFADHGIGSLARTPLLADVDGDGRAEILLLEFRTPGRLWAFAADGQLVWRTTLPTAVFHAPVAADLDGDGRVEVVVPLTDGRIAVVTTFGDAAAASALPWPEPQQSALARSGAVDPGEPDDAVTAATWLGLVDSALRARRLADQGGGFDYMALKSADAGTMTVRLYDVPAAASLNLHVWDITGAVPAPLGSSLGGGSGDKHVDFAVAAGDRIRIGVEILAGGGAAAYAIEVTRAP